MKKFFVVLKNYVGPGGNVTIPDSIISIGNYAFACHTRLKSIIIPDGVREIGKWAFYGCTGLENVTIPDSIIRIGNYAFSDCDNLTVHVPAGSYAERYAKRNKIPFVVE